MQQDALLHMFAKRDVHRNDTNEIFIAIFFYFLGQKDRAQKKALLRG